MRKTWFAAVMAAALVIAVPAASLAHPSGQVIGNGGGTASGGGFVLNGTVGQPAVGVSGGTFWMVCHGFWCFGGSRVIGVEPPAGIVLPEVLSVGPAFPNPSRDAVSFVLALPKAAEVRLAVYDVAGREVGTPVTQAFDAGWQRISWRAPQGRAGVYFARLVVDGQPIGERRIVFAR